MANQKPHDEVRIGTVKAAIWQTRPETDPLQRHLLHELP